ncbi:MAG: bifunctional demethylmenaquinone methyltransferase/2-methoxy-6-polyprenyl-1,4-benzoquinol methylase UbiE [Chitinophagaceae bacterium]
MDYPHDNIVPDKKETTDKKKQVSTMFNEIASLYDTANRLLSLGIDKNWRKKALKELKLQNPQYILDVATGTGDFAIMTYEYLKSKKIIGIDIAQKMLEQGHKKTTLKNLQSHIEFQLGDAEKIQFPDCSFDAITVAFGVRNFENLLKGLQEMYRVLKPNGKCVILEFSQPKGWFQYIYNIYLKYITPNIGGLITRKKTAYLYLRNSIQAFPERNNFEKIMQNAGFEKTYRISLSGGICHIYVGCKKL